jgi:MinD superfamily P-loop ATPase
VPCLVPVHKADLYPAASGEIEQFCPTKNYSCLGCLPFDPGFIRAQVEGKTIMEYSNKKLHELLTEVWEQLPKAAAQSPPKTA